MSQLTVTLAQLRHAYQLLMNGHVTDTKEFARGLIAPQIRRLERLLRMAQSHASDPSAEFQPDEDGMYDFVIRLRSNQPFIDLGDTYTIDGREGTFTCGGHPPQWTPPGRCAFVLPTHRCALLLNHTTPHQMVQIDHPTAH